MSAALILLCVVTVAQNEKSTKGVTDNTHGVIVSQSTLTLSPGEEAYVSYTVELGYKDPVLIYNGKSFEMSDRYIFGDFFLAEILTANSSGGLLRIITDLDIDEDKSDVIYVKAIIDYDGVSRIAQLSGVPIFIDCIPDSKQ